MTAMAEKTLENASLTGDRSPRAMALLLAGVLDRAAGVLERIAHPLARYSSLTGSLMIFAMAGLILVDVIFRHAFNRPFTITIELEQFMLACAVYLSIAWAMIKGDHVRVDLFSSRFSPRLKRYTESLFSIYAMAVFFILAWQLILKAVEAVEVGEAGEVTGIPLIAVLSIVLFGAALMFFVLLIRWARIKSEFLKQSSRPFLGSMIIIGMAAATLTAPFFLRNYWSDLNLSMIGLFGIVFLLILMLIGLRIALAMALVGFLGIWLINSPDTALSVVRMKAYESVADYFLCVVPFFVLMGMFCFRAGLSRSAYNAAYHWLGPLPGGVAISTVAGCGCFAAICGDSMATAATMGSVSLPEMRRYNYDDSLATGALAAGGTLGILIPPSVGFIVYGLIAEVSVAKLFVAGIIPGVLMAVLFAAVILFRCRFNPGLGPRAKTASRPAKLKALRGVWPVLLLFAVVMGGIYSGYITPTEAGAIGALGALAVGLISGRGLGWKGFFQALEESMRMTAMIFLILIGVSILGFFTVATEIPLQMSDFIASMEVSRYVILALILALYLLLGMVMNIIPMIMLTLPIIFPTVIALGFDPIWFGVVTVIMMEMGQITPPVGINVFVISGVARDVPMATIFRGIIPFLLIQLFIVFILIFLPSIATYLPGLMKTLPSLGG